MGLLAYDLRRLEALRVALGAALDYLHAIRCDDAAAEPAMTGIRTATRTLNEFCIPRVHDILASDSMTSYHAADVDGNAIHNSLVYTMATSYRWKVSTDPFEDDAQIVTVEEARALGFRLQHGDLDKLTSTAAERAFIVQQLAVITADPRCRPSSSPT